MKLSVCLTAYGRTHLLARTLESLAAQTRPPDELIVSDDCSPDDPTAVAESFRHRFVRFRYNRNPRNLSMPANLNLVVGMAGGEYVANLHDADVFHPQLLEKWEEALLRHRGVAPVDRAQVQGRSPRRPAADARASVLRAAPPSPVPLDRLGNGHGAIGGVPQAAAVRPRLRAYQ
jgi:glycosyltransferase involved in cell wall biosynthesis